VKAIVAAGRVGLLDLRSRQGRILALLAFAGLFIATAATAAVLGREHGHVELDTLFQIGGYPLISGVLLVGWLLGRFPLMATLVLMSGIVAADRDAGHVRLLAARPASQTLLVAVRFGLLGGLAFLLSAMLMPLFDLIMLGAWAGPALLVLILAHVAVWGSLTVLLSVFTRLDAWLTLLLALFALVWGALRQAGMLPVVAPIGDVIAFVLPPQAQLFALESAFVGVEPIPWAAFWFCMAYGAVALVLAARALSWREL
jgi:ABC-type transport system involved in multi-copper enzyme maturation permease subunit